MKKIQHFFALLMGISCLNSCLTGDKYLREGDMIPLKSIKLDAGKGSLSYDTIEIIKPIMPDDVIHANIAKIQYFNNNFYVLDSKQNQLIAFTREGLYKGCIGKHGNGPGEYYRIDDFDISPEGELYILDANQKKIHQYSAVSLKPQGDISIECSGTKFSAANSTSFFFENVFVNHSKRSKLVKYNIKTGKVQIIRDYLITNEYNSVGKGRTHLWRSGNTILFYDRFSPDIYSLSDTTCNILYSLETENLPDEKMIHKMINK